MTLRAGTWPKSLPKCGYEMAAAVESGKALRVVHTKDPDAVLLKIGLISDL